MFKKSLLTLVALLATLQMSAAPVDVSAAKTKAEQYLASKVYAGKYMAPKATQVTLIKTEMSDIAKVPVYYIFNTATTFVIVSGDDRAEDILAYGDKPLNLDRIPDGLKYLMDCYKEQLNWLISNPSAEVEKAPKLRADGAKATTYGPLLTCNWGQEAPYWDQCVFSYRRLVNIIGRKKKYRTDNLQCLTGCPATSAAMVMYYYKYPAEVGPLDSYTAQLAVGWDNSIPYNIPQQQYATYDYPALPETTFDWDNMQDEYDIWYDQNGISHCDNPQEQCDAVATLMRYIGQAEEMEYGIPDYGSGVPYSRLENIVNMFETFGYNAQLLEKKDFSEAAWADKLQKEMAAGRPVVYLASNNMVGGHAFNVDGYDGTDKYHINWGWNGEGNAWCVMNDFTGRDITFSEEQKMVIVIKPIPGDVNGDREVNISDINALIDIILNGNTSSPNYGRADVNGDGEVNISDVNAIIDIIMGR